MSTNSKPVYDFLGYHLISAKVMRNQPFVCKEINIRVENIFHKNEEFSFTTLVDGSESKEASFAFRFHARFSISDKKWADSLGGDDAVVSVLFPVVFPFIRQSIFSATNDSLGGIFIPIIDLRGAKVTEGIRLIRADNPDNK